MEHLNVGKGRAISDYEAFFILAEKLIKEKIDQGSKGIVIAKGQKNEKKFTYTQAALVLQRIESTEAMQGKFSFGVCQTCHYYSCSSYTAGILGVCKLDNKKHDCFESCDKHSKEGGFGI